MKQDRSSPLSPSEIKEHLDRLGDQLFTGTCTLPPSNRKLREHKSKVSDTRPEQLNTPPLLCYSTGLLDVDHKQVPEAFNVFDAQVTQQGLQGLMATPVSCKEVVAQSFFLHMSQLTASEEELN